MSTVILNTKTVHKCPGHIPHEFSAAKILKRPFTDDDFMWPVFLASSNCTSVRLCWCFGRSPKLILQFCAFILLSVLSVCFRLQTKNVVSRYQVAGKCFFFFKNRRLYLSRDFSSMPKLRELVHYKTKTLFSIAWHFSTNIEISQRLNWNYDLHCGVRVR